MLVKNRQTFTIVKAINSNTITNYLDIPFPADELRIVQVIYVSDPGATTDYVNVLSWEGVGDLFLFDNSNASANVNIRLNVHGKLLRGTHTFKIRTDTGPQNGLVGVLGFIFEAIQY